MSETSKVTAETNENELSAEERSVLIKEVIELQEGLKALIQKVEAVKDDHNQIQSGNQILQTYINNLMASNVLSSSVNINAINAANNNNNNNSNNNNNNNNNSNSNNNSNGSGSNLYN